MQNWPKQDLRWGLGQRSSCGTELASLQARKTERDQIGISKKGGNGSSR